MASEKKSGEKVKYLLRRPAGEYETEGKVIGVNGVMYTVPYDKEVEVPEAVADILDRAQAAARKRYTVEQKLSGRS